MVMFYLDLAEAVSEEISSDAGQEGRCLWLGLQAWGWVACWIREMEG